MKNKSALVFSHAGGVKTDDGIPSGGPKDTLAFLKPTLKLLTVGSTIEVSAAHESAIHAAAEAVGLVVATAPFKNWRGKGVKVKVIGKIRPAASQSPRTAKGEMGG